MSVLRTYLELTDPADLRPADPPRLPGRVDIARVDPPDGGVNAWFYAEVGRGYAWVDHAGRTPAEWQARAEAVETWVLTVDGRWCGYAELDAGDGAVEVAYLGIVPSAHGRGLGGHLLTFVLRRALELAPRVWLHTCTTDGPYALANYEARGLRPFRTETLPAA